MLCRLGKQYRCGSRIRTYNEGHRLPEGLFGISRKEAFQRTVCSECQTGDCTERTKQKGRCRSTNCHSGRKLTQFGIALAAGTGLDAFAEDNSILLGEKGSVDRIPG